MGLLAIACMVLLIILIPNEIWAILFYLAVVALVCFVGFWAAIMWLAGSA